MPAQRLNHPAAQPGHPQRRDQRYREGGDGQGLGQPALSLATFLHQTHLELAQLWRRAGLVAEIWEPASGSIAKRSDEWLGLWRQPPAC